ncbi:hypothetical protein D3C80_1528080 [compost metagenome]
MAPTLARLRIRPVTTPTAAPSGAPPASAKSRIRYLDKICSRDSPLTVQPTRPVMTDASRMIRHRISSLRSALLFILKVNNGSACKNTRVNTNPSRASTAHISSGYQAIDGPITIRNSPTINDDTNTINGA